MGQGESTEGAYSNAAIVPAPAGSPGSMKAWVLSAPGEISSLRSTTLRIPEPGKGEVRIKVICAGLNPVDYKRAAIETAAFPCIPGVDAAGIIDALGDGVDNGVSVGDRVHVHMDLRRPYGSFAEYTITSANVVSLIPESVSFADAAALPCAGWTAFVAVAQKLKVERGRTILITGGAGGVGGFALQLCKFIGANVITTASQGNVKALTDAGVMVIDYTTEAVVDRVLEITNGSGVDYVLDTVSVENAMECSKALRFGGELCSLVGYVPCDDAFFSRQLSVHHVFLGGLHRDVLTEPMLKGIGDSFMQMVASGSLKSSLTEVCTFDQIPSGLNALQSRHTKGKIVASLVAKSRVVKDQPAAAASAPQAQAEPTPAKPSTPVPTPPQQSASQAPPPQAPAALPQSLASAPVQWTADAPAQAQPQFQAQQPQAQPQAQAQHYQQQQQHAAPSPDQYPPHYQQQQQQQQQWQQPSQQQQQPQQQPQPQAPPQQPQAPAAQPAVQRQSPPPSPPSAPVQASHQYYQYPPPYPQQPQVPAPPQAPPALQVQPQPVHLQHQAPPAAAAEPPHQYYQPQQQQQRQQQQQQQPAVPQPERRASQEAVHVQAQQPPQQPPQQQQQHQQQQHQQQQQQQQQQQHHYYQYPTLPQQHQYQQQPPQQQQQQPAQQQATPPATPAPAPQAQQPAHQQYYQPQQAAQQPPAQPPAQAPTKAGYYFPPDFSRRNNL